MPPLAAVAPTSENALPNAAAEVLDEWEAGVTMGPPGRGAISLDTL